jgi:hypothetical protein
MTYAAGHHAVVDSRQPSKESNVAEHRERVPEHDSTMEPGLTIGQRVTARKVARGD